jgi:hypothetical protein
MKNVNVVNKSNKDLFVWVQDLNTNCGDLVAEAKTIKTGDPPLAVTLQQDQNGNVNYHWLAIEVTSYVRRGYVNDNGTDLDLNGAGTQLPISIFMRRGFP